jgi:autotransporter-associated beta strand protein
MYRKARQHARKVHIRLALSFVALTVAGAAAATEPERSNASGTGNGGEIDFDTIPSRSAESGKLISTETDTDIWLLSEGNLQWSSTYTGSALALDFVGTGISETLTLAFNLNPGSNLSGSAAAKSVDSILAPDVTKVWRNGGLLNVWNFANNWSPNGIPTVNDTAQFDNTANPNNLTPSIGATNTSVGAILFATGTTNAYNILGTATLTIGSDTVSGITNASATNQRFSVSTIALGISQAWNVQSTGNLSFSSAVSLGDNTLALGGASTGAGSISGVISGNGGNLTKFGGNTWTLSGANTYTGATAVVGGTLLINGSTSSSSAVTVINSGSILGGTGTINGTVTINSGASILGGTGAAASGALTLSNNLTLNSGSIIQLALGGAGAHSTLARTGGIWSFQSNQAFTFINLGATVGTYDNIITGLASNPGTGNWTITNPGFAGTFTFDGANIDLTLTAVPEPSTWIGGVFALAALGYAQRRRLVRATGSRVSQRTRGSRGELALNG